MGDLKVLSLFDGISCARIALGNRCASYTASEIDPAAIKCSKQNWPDISHIGDVKSVNPSDFLGIDLLIGGSPCQDLSSANPKQDGLNGQKSGLFWEYVRILKGSKPRYFIFENVYSMTMKARDEISEALGVQPIMINSSLFSAQSRKRLFWTNINIGELPKDTGITLQNIALRGKALEKENPKFLKKEDFVPLTKPNSGDLICVGNVRGSAYSTERVYSADGKTCTLRCRCREYFQIHGLVRQLTITEIERLQCLPDGYTRFMGSKTKRMHGIGNGFCVEVIKWILSHIPDQTKQPEVSPREQRLLKRSTE
jgi:site-specific DNA-cytosine methylase